MEAFNCPQRVLSLADLNKRTRLPKSTLHRLVDQMCQVGWLEREHGGYRVGLRMFELGTLAVEGNRLHEAAFPHLQALASRTGLAAQLAILDQAEVVYLERIVVGPIRLPTRRGGRKPAYCTALGKAIAAYDDAATRAVIEGPMPRKTAKTVTEPFALWTELQRVRDEGVAFDRGEAYEELECVAAPIRSSGRAIAAVSVTGPALDAVERGDRGGARHGVRDLEREPQRQGPRHHQAVTGGQPRHRAGGEPAGPVAECPFRYGTL